jgi:hypothetical protein
MFQSCLIPLWSQLREVLISRYNSTSNRTPPSNSHAVSKTTLQILHGRLAYMRAHRIFLTDVPLRVLHVSSVHQSSSYVTLPGADAYTATKIETQLVAFVFRGHQIKPNLLLVRMSSLPYTQLWVGLRINAEAKTFQDIVMER